MSDPIIHWPDEQAEQVEAARGRLEVAGPQLADRPRDEVVAILGQVLERFRNPSSQWHADLRDGTIEHGGFSREMVDAGLELALSGWTGEALAALVARELDQPLVAMGRRLAPFPATSVIPAGAIPMPNLLAGMLPLLLGSPVLIKPAARDPLTPVLLARCIADLDPDLGRCLEVTSFSSTDSECLGRFLASECIVANGSNETMAEIVKHLSPSQRFVGYGHKFSIAVVHAPSLMREDRCREIADSLSVDIALWDQLGCLSPLGIYVSGENAREAVQRLLDSLADALAERADAWPRGEASREVRAAIKQERDEAEMRRAQGEAVGLRHSSDTSWTVIAEDSAHWRPTPLHRFIRLHPLSGTEALAQALSPRGAQLSSVAVAGFETAPDEGAKLTRSLRSIGACRVCAAGKLQAPALSWPHDGRPVLLPMARFMESEPGTGE